MNVYSEFWKETRPFDWTESVAASRCLSDSLKCRGANLESWPVVSCMYEVTIVLFNVSPE